MSESFGTGPSRVLPPDDLAYQLTIFQAGKPPTDAELNFIGQLNNEERRKMVKSLMPSGIIGDPTQAHLDFYTHPSFSNFFYMGRQLEQETSTTSIHTSGLKHILWANVDGWIIPITGTQVNELALVDDDYRNKIVLPFGPSSDFNTNFVFLEVWKALVEATPSSVNKPTASSIYKYGNVEFGGTNPADDLIPPTIGRVTTKRIQIQYRIRALPNIDLISYPTGFGAEGQVYARANLSEGAASTLAGSMDTSFKCQSAVGDPGLWRAGNGTPTNGLGTVDGYVYAIPLVAVRRRNRSGWALSTTNGGISRRSTPSGYVEGTPSGCTLSALELAAVPPSDRPDGLYTDLIEVGDNTDIIDMRHHVWPGGHDRDSVLDETLKALLSNKLRTSAKMFTPGGTQFGPTLLVTDELNSTGTDTPQTVLVGEPDDVRRIFSDVPIYQGKNLENFTIASKDPSSPSWGASPTKWMPGDIIVVSHPTSLNAEDYPSQMLADQFTVTYRGGTRPIITNMVTSSTGGNLVSTGAFTNYTAANLTGYAVEITGGVGLGQIRTIDSVVGANEISIFGTWSVNPTSASSFQVVPLILTASAVATATEMTITIETINGDDDPASSDLSSANLTGDLWVEYTMYYPAGQGLSLRPDLIHQVNYTNPSSTVLVSPGADVGVNYMKPRNINHSSDFMNPALPSYFGTHPVMADCYVDEGSKTQVIQPWQRFSNGVQVRRLHTFNPSHNYFSLFHTRFAWELPKSRMPALGYNAIPALAPADATSVFPSGLNVWLISEADTASEAAVNLLGRTSYSDDTFEGDSVFARRGATAYEATTAGAPDKIGCRVNPDVGGIEFPRYIGISRIIGIYEDGDFDLNGLTGTNLLVVPAENNEVPENIWIGRTTGHTDVTFTVLPGAITGYDAANGYVVVCNVFGFRQGFLTENQFVTAHEQVVSESATATLHTVVTGGLPSSAIVQTTYTRTPYQGSVYSRMEPFADNTPEPFNNRGLVSPTALTDLATPLDAAPDQGVVYHFEVLATREFVTTLGTARFSGVGSGRFYGKKDMASSIPNTYPKHEILSLSDVQAQHAGFISRLPLGARFRDADFAGEDVQCGTDTGPTIFFSDGEVKPSKVIFDEATNADPIGAGQIVTATQGNLSSYSDTTRYRATRGGSAYQRIGNAEGAPVTTGGRTCGVGFKAVYGVAALVRNFREYVPKNVDSPYNAITNPYTIKSPGGELHMVILTGANLNVHDVQGLYEPQTVGGSTAPTGIGEGYTAVDRYRCVGRPLEFQPREITFPTGVVVEDALTERVLTPSILSVYPQFVDAEDAVLISGTGILVAPSNTTNLGAELYARPVNSLGGDDLINLTQFVTDSTSTQIVFWVPSTAYLPRGRYDLIVRAADGQVARIKNALESTASASNSNQVKVHDNFYEYEPGDLPMVTGGFSTNSTGSFRVTDADASITSHCAIFRGTGLTTTETVKIDRTNDLRVGTGTVSVRWSFKLDEAVPANNTMSIKAKTWTGAVYRDLVGMSVASGAGFFTLTAYAGVNGGVDSTMFSPTAVDLEWHSVELVVDMTAVTWSLYFDGVLAGTGTAAGATIVGNEEPRQFECANSRSAGTTSGSLFFDNLVLQNFPSSTLTG